MAPADAPAPPDAGDTGTRAPSLWPDTGRLRGAAGSSLFNATRFDPLHAQATQARHRLGLQFHLCQPALALRVLLAVQAAVLLAGAPLAQGWVDAASRAAVGAFAAMAGTLLWLPLVCGLRPWLASRPTGWRHGLLVALGALAALAGWGLRLPAAQRVHAVQPARPVKQILADPGVGLAVAGAVVAYGVMNLLMTATPLAMLCTGQPFDATATVIQWHLVAMFAPSFLTGSLVGRIGALRVMLIGSLISLAAIALAMAGDSYAYFQWSLVCVGLGWNLLYVGATTLLAEHWRAEEKGRVQAVNDSLVFLGVTLATLGAAPLVDRLGWSAVNAWAAIPLLVMVLVLLFCSQQKIPTKVF